MSITFNYVPVTEDQKAQMQIYRDKFQALYEDLLTLPKNRGLSVALTKLEESGMWVNKSITNNC